MKHLINGQPIDLRSLSPQELGSLINTTRARIERTQEELDSLNGELIRRSDNVHLLHPYYEGPSVA